MCVWFGAGVALHGAAAVAWSPSSLSGLEFWIDPSDVPTVTYSGGAASRVNDKSGNGRHIEQSDSDKQPSYGVATKNGRKVMGFDGNDNLRSANWTKSQPVTMFAVAQNSSDGDYGNRQIVGNTNPVSPTFYKSSNVWRLYAGAELVSDTAVDTDWHCLTGVVNSESSLYRLDGQVIAEGDAGGQPWDDSPISIGDSAESWGSFGWIGGIAEVLIYSRILTDTEIAQVETYLRNKWDTSVPASTTTTVPPTTTTTTTTTTSTVPVTTTTVRPVTTTVAPALDIVVNAPPTSAAPATTVPVGQAQIPMVSTPVITAAPRNSPSATVTTASSTTTTSTTLPNNTGATVPPRAPSPPQVVAGAAAVKVGDTTEEATVERSDNQLVVTAGALEAVIGGMNPDGTPIALDEAGNVRLRTGDTVRIKLAGFEPGSVMEAWLFSTPVLLGTTKVGSDGSVIGTFTIPDNAPSGSHRVVIVASTTDGKPATLAVGINVGEWEKESSLTVWLIVLPIVLAVLGALLLPATRRRRRGAGG
jgi:hypothetical protein